MSKRFLQVEVAMRGTTLAPKKKKGLFRLFGKNKMNDGKKH